MSAEIVFFSSSSRSIRSTMVLSWPLAKLVLLFISSSVFVNFRGCVPLLAGRVALISRFPLLIGHAIDLLARLIAAHRQPARLGLLLVPVGQAIAAEAGEVHEIDVLDIASLAQMPDEPAESRRFELHFVLRIGFHGRPHTDASRR